MYGKAMINIIAFHPVFDIVKLGLIGRGLENKPYFTPFKRFLDVPIGNGGAESQGLR
jgi:hypothetical protein